MNSSTNDAAFSPETIVERDLLWRQMWGEDALEPYQPLIVRWRRRNPGREEMLELLASRGLHGELARGIVRGVLDG